MTAKFKEDIKKKHPYIKSLEGTFLEDLMIYAEANNV